MPGRTGTAAVGCPAHTRVRLIRAGAVKSPRDAFVALLATPWTQVGEGRQRREVVSSMYALWQGEGVEAAGWSM